MHPLLRATLAAAVALAGIAGAAPIQAQQPLSVPSASGREFWLVFQKNFRDYVTNAKTEKQEPAAPLELELCLASAFSCTGYVEIPGLGFRERFTLAPGRVHVMRIDSAAQLRGSGVVEKLGIHVVADQPVTVYGLNHRYQSTDSYLAIPVEALGTEYRAIGYRWLQNDLLSQMAVVATEDNTVVRIVAPVGLQQLAPPLAAAATKAATTKAASREKGRERKGRAAATPPPASAALARVAVIPDGPLEVTLQKGEALQIIPRYDPSGTSDLTGTLVRATKPVAVFSGHNCAYVPDVSIKACNMLSEQMPPVSSWGTTFGVGAIEGRSWSVIRVLARFDSTIVAIDGREVARLKAGEFFEQTHLAGNALVVASRPVLLVQFAPGFDNGDNLGDPMMIVVPPLEQFDNVYTIATPVRGSFRHFLNIAVRTSAIEQLSIDGHPVDQTRFKPLAASDYSIGRLEISYGTHVVSGRERFGLYQYGLGFDDAAYDAYGNAGGQLYLDLDAAAGGRDSLDRELPDIGLLTR